MNAITKRQNGQYYTISNAFSCVGFLSWLNQIQDFENRIILEPFAGTNNIPYLFNQATNTHNLWYCCDIALPTSNLCPQFPIIQNDSLLNFPKGYSICITNPPYLAKNSATRRKLDFPKTHYDNLYKLCLSLMLSNCDYVAAIIPESFLTSRLFQERLHSVISLPCTMFNDTDYPTCLALFNPEISNDFAVYSLNSFVGFYSALTSFIEDTPDLTCWKFNDPAGNIGIYCIDNNCESSIRFCLGTEIDASSVKSTSRSITRVSGLPEDFNETEFILACNNLLRNYREHSQDFGLTSFKGLRKDGKFRRRMDYKFARKILNRIYADFLY